MTVAIAAPAEYSPGITKERWKELIADNEVFTGESLTAFACMQKADNSTCSDMAEQFGRTKAFYNNAVWRTGQHVHQKTNCPLSLRKNGEKRYWSVCCTGKYLDNGRFEYKIRPELQAAFDETKVLEGVKVMDERDVKELFKNWMRKKRKENGESYSENTINSYCSALNNSPQKLEIERQYQKSIFLYTDADEYDKAKDIILKAPNFDTVNKAAGNQAFKYGMLCYEEFINEIINKRKSPMPNETARTNNIKDNSGQEEKQNG